MSTNLNTDTGTQQYFFEACWTLVLRKVTSVSERLAHYFLAQAGFKKTEGQRTLMQAINTLENSRASNRTSQQPPPASGASGPSASSPGSSSHEASTHASQHPQASGASGLGPSSHGSSQHASPQPLASVSGTHGTDPSNTASEDAPQDVSNGIVIVDEDDEQLAPLAYPPGLMTFARREMIERSLKVSYKTGKPYPNTSDKPHYDKYKLETWSDLS
ncbi:hypothetical protein CYMTET_45089 [Cymbomonas tetramitiformis]|uniref:Uncharacterized protein n=1 Tax=Cymbomonas tetramitiformis TaxID=36881 RepID=A0AAE0C0Z8_9CHLO|nr:hypothetical protein CYMTET_45089 [Cymbomonas tetramitiformis]